MPHLIDELSQALPPVPTGVRESRYGGADEDTQHTPPAACPCGSHGHHAEQVVTVGPALATSASLTLPVVPPQAGPKPAVKRADLHDVVLSALAHTATCPGTRDCECDVDPDVVENTARDVVTNLVGVLRTAGVRVEEPVGYAGTDPRLSADLAERPF